MELLKTNHETAVLDIERNLVKSEDTNQIIVTENIKRVSKDEEDKTKTESESEYSVYLHKFIDRLTIHGVYDIYEVDSWFLKMLLIICFLASASYCFYQIVNSVLIYLQFNVVTNSQAYISVPTEFPVVAFCNLVIKSS